MKKKLFFIPVAAFYLAFIFIRVLPAEELSDSLESQNVVQEKTEKLEEEDKISGVAAETKETAPLPGLEASPAVPKRRTANISSTGQKGDNFIRLNVEKDGQLMQIQIDPLAVDAYIDIRYGIQGSEDMKQAEDVLKKRMTEPEAEQKTASAPEDEVDKKVKDLVKDFEPAKKKDKSMTEQVLQHIIKAQQLFYSGDYDGALSSAKAAVRLEKTASGYSLLGSIFYVTEDTDGAIAAWEKSLSIDPNQPEVTEILNYLKQ